MGIRRELDRNSSFTYERKSDRLHKDIHENKRAALSFQSGEAVRPACIAQGNLEALKNVRVYEDLSAPLEDRLEGAVTFEPALCSPYAMALDGQEYDPVSEGLLSGLCPLCNNARHAEYDAFIMRHLGEQGKWKNIPFPRQVIERHLALHILPVYTVVGQSSGPLKGPTGEAQVSGAIVAGIKRMVATNRRAEALIREEEHAESGGILLAAVEGTLPEPEPIPGYKPSPSIRQAPSGARAKAWYAYNGASCQGALRLWGKDRMDNEVEKRAVEAIVFYDEMVESRAMAHRIYSEIMDSDIEEANRIAQVEAEAEGKRGRYIERNYGAAIQAVKLKKEIATDMARLALIAQRFGDEREKGGKPISAAVRAILDDLGLSQGARGHGDDATEVSGEVVL